MVTNIDRSRLLELIDQCEQLVDVLPDAEYTAQHIPGAISMRVADATRPDIPTATPDETLGEVRRRVRVSDWDEVVVVD